MRRLMAGRDWAGALDDDIEPELRARILRFIELLENADLDGLEEVVSPSLVVAQPPQLPDARTYRGREALIETVIDWPSQWEEIVITPIRTWQAAPGVLVFQNHQVFRGAESGLELETDFWFVFVWREGRLERWTMHASEEEALQAAG